MCIDRPSPCKASELWGADHGIMRSEEEGSEDGDNEGSEGVDMDAEEERRRSYGEAGPPGKLGPSPKFERLQ